MCRYLEDIDLTRVGSLTDDGVAALAEGCGGLRRLVLNAAGAAGGRGLTDGALIALQRSRVAGSLVHLDLSWCRSVSDEALGLLVDSAPNLASLVLRGCSQITDVFINGHSNGCLTVRAHALRDLSVAAARHPPPSPPT